MKDPALIANLALALRVVLVGGFMIALPRITRKGLLFGVYVGEETTDGDAARRLRVEWPRGCLLVMLLSISAGYGISLLGSPFAGSMIGTAVLILASFGLYIRFHHKALELAPPEAARQAAQATASLRGGRDLTAVRLAWCAFVFGAVVSVATLVYAVASLDGIWTGRTFFQVTFIPGTSLWVCPFLAVLAVLTASAKRSLRGGSGGRSAEVQEAFRLTMTRALSWIAIVTCIVMVVMSIEVIRLTQHPHEPLGLRFFLPLGVVFVFGVGTMLRIMRRFGQGGALQEEGSAEAPLTNGLADDAHWVWGLFYVDADDPAVMVESRFGFGYTFNYGNRTAKVIIGSFFGLAAALVVFWLVAPAIGAG